MCPSEREADVFLLAVGELSWPRVPRATWHWLTCAACRRNVRRMRRASARLGAANVTRVWAMRFSTVALASVSLFSMWALGREAVGAAMSAMERPHMRNTSYEPEPGLPIRPSK